MKIKLLFFVIGFLGVFGISYGQIISWNFTSNNNPNTNLPNGLTALSYNTGGTSGTSGCTGNGFSINGWNVNEYLQIVAPITGYNITTVTFNVQSSGTGPSNFKVQYSSSGTGGVFTDLGTTFLSGNGSCASRSADFTAINALDNNANTVIRLVFTGGEADGSPATGDAATGGNFRIDDLVINGTVLASTPTLSTTTVSSTAQFSATSGGTISSQGGSAVTARGIIWGTTASLAISQAPARTSSNGTGTGAFASDLAALKPNTRYYYRAYATNAQGTAYGTELFFDTPAQTGTQMAFWNFGPDQLGYTAVVTSETVVGTPTLNLTDGTIDTDGKDGVAYNDILNTSHSRGQAAGWNDVNTGSQGDINFTINTTGFGDLFLKLDYKGTSVNSMDVEYSVNGGAFVPAFNNAAIVANRNSNDYNWNTIRFDLSAIAAIENASSVTFRLNDFDRNGDDEFIFDNLEIIGTVLVPEINITGNGNSIPDGTVATSATNHTDFGSIPTAAGTIVRTFTVLNTAAATAALSLTGASPYVAIGGAHPADFTVTVIPSASIAINSFTTFQVTFNPSADGVRTASISVANNDGDENPYNFNIQGTGVAVPVIFSPLTAAGTQSAPFTYTIAANNNPTSYNATGLPTGLNVNTTTGVISGTPTVAGTFNVTITATNSAGTDTETLVVTLSSAPCINEGFAGGTTPPSGWSFTSIGTYTTAGNFGVASPSLEFDNTNERVQTTTITGLATELSFWIKGQSTNATSSLLVEGFNGSSWETIENIVPISQTATTKIYNSASSPTLDQSFVRFRFTYSKSAGNLALDDILVNCAAACSPPTTQASVFTSTAVTPISATIGWTRGNGNNVLVLAKAASAVDTDPVSGNTYTDNLAFGQGSQLGTGNFVLVSGAINTANITGLTAGTAYHFAVYEWNNTNQCYNLTQLTGNFTTPACTPTVVSTIFPTSGPVGTDVTITASSGTFVGATAKFNGIAATVLSTSATTLIVKIPSSATSGNLVITNASNCPTTNAYTIINSVNTDCEGGTRPTDLFISEVTDETFGSLTYVEIYNGTAAAINLGTGNYSIAVHNNGQTTACPTALTGSIPANGIFILALGSATNAGSVVPNQTSLFCSINNNDNVRLLKNGADLDQFGYRTNTNLTGVGAVGYTFRRKNNVVAPKSPAFLESDWDVIDAPDDAGFGLGTNYSNIGFYTARSGGPPSVAAPTYSANCKTATITVVGTEGYNGPTPADTKDLAYRWFFNVPNTAGWTEITIDGVLYTGTATATLSISNISSVLNYQYYCQVRENTATCYTASTAVKILDGKITWNGTNWVDVNNVIASPSISKTAIINSNYSTASGSFDACSVLVNSNRTLTITANSYVKIQNELANSGTVTINDSGSLVQVNDVAVNTGNITYERNYYGILWDAYTYWSSPVANQNLLAVSPTTKSDKFFSFNAAANSWVTENPSSTTMGVGKGYIIRAAPIVGPPPGFLTNSFIGVPNNGTITTTINWNGATDGTSNLIGNPYPSAIDAVKFLTANAGVIESTIYFWTHNTTIQDRNIIIANGGTPGSGVLAYTSDDYASYNLTGGVATGNFVPGTPGAEETSNKPNGKIAAGQAFFATSLIAQASTTATFNNSMRVDNSNNMLDNSQFFRIKNPQTKTETSEKHRIWLNLKNTEGIFKQTLIGYLTDATNQYDTRFDGISFDANKFADFYSICQDKNLVIQGRTLPFTENDEVKLGFRTTIEGAFSLNIDATDGILTKQAVFIEDKLANSVFDLRSGTYNFTTKKGTFDDRFILRYTNKTLGTVDLETVENQVSVSNKNKQIKVNSEIEIIEKVTVYDLIGRQLYIKENLNSNELAISNLISSQQTLLVKVSLKNGQTVTKKIIY